MKFVLYNDLLHSTKNESDEQNKGRNMYGKSLQYVRGNAEIFRLVEALYTIGSIYVTPS